MVKRYTIHLIVQLCVLILVGSMTFFSALILTGGLGGMAMGIAPEPTFGMVESIVCPDGILKYYSVKRSYHEPGESEPHVECEAEDGTQEDVLIGAVLSVLGVIFLVIFGVIFLPIFALLAIGAFVLTRKLLTDRNERIESH